MVSRAPISVECLYSMTLLSGARAADSAGSGGCRGAGRGLHSSTFRLTVSALCGTGGAFRGCLGCLWGVRGYLGCLRCILCRTRLKLS